MARPARKSKGMDFSEPHTAYKKKRKWPWILGSAALLSSGAWLWRDLKSSSVNTPSIAPIVAIEESGAGLSDLISSGLNAVNLNSQKEGTANADADYPQRVKKVFEEKLKQLKGDYRGEVIFHAVDLDTGETLVAHNESKPVVA